MRLRRVMHIRGARTRIAIALCLGLTSPLWGALPGFRLMDPNLDVELIDTHPDAFFISQAMDLSGQLFVGSREALFVYGRTPEGGFTERRELYRFPGDSWLYDIEVYGDDLFVLCNTALYRIPGAVTQHENLKPEKLLWGAPMGHYHQGLHGMELGPNGDLYLSMGDPQPHMHWDRERPDHLWHWTFYVGPENTPVVYNGNGAILRYRLRDHHLSVHSSGYRNACALSFDPNWNLFANDNDQEGSRFSPCRLLYAPAQSWNGWVRGWAARLNPKRMDILPVTNLELAVPVGQCWYDDTVLGESYRGSILVANWGNHSISQHKISPDGAGFEAPSVALLVCDSPMRPVSVIPSNDGRLIAAICYMQSNEGSPVRKSDLVIISPRAQSFPLQDFSKGPVTDLLDAPWQLRYKAHQEILRVGGGPLKKAAKRFRREAPGSPVMPSLMVLAAREGSSKSISRIRQWTKQSVPLSTDALRVAAAFPEKFRNLDINAIAAQGNNPRRLHALLEYLHVTATSVPEAAITLAAHEDPYVRQSAARLLARLATDEEKTRWATGDVAHRLAAVLSAGFRICDAAEAARGIPQGGQPAPSEQLQQHYADGDLNLSDLGQPIGIFMISSWWAQAHNRDPRAADFSILQTALKDTDARIRTAAAVSLFYLKDDRVDAQVMDVLAYEGITLGSTDRASRDTKAMAAAQHVIRHAKLPGDEDIPADFKGLDWDQESAKGDAALGKKLFTQRACIACHLSPDDGRGGAIGPSFRDLGNRFSATYLAESILVPNRAVSPNFHPVSLRMADGTVQTGFIEGEDADALKLRIVSGQLIEIPVTKVVKRDISRQSMMPAGLVQSPQELRDLLRYLLASPVAN